MASWVPVGYNGISNTINEDGDTGKNIGIGGLFVPIAGGNTFKLGEISVQDPEDDPMDAENEYIQELAPTGAKTIGRYTCLTANYLKLLDMYEDFGEFCGWWDVTDQSLSFFDDIMGNDKYDASEKEITVGTAFLGLISSADRRFVSAGAVPQESTGFNNDGNKNPFFLNYLPVEIKLGQCEMIGEYDGDESVDPVDAENEYLQVLAPNGAKTIARYTYLSKDYLVLLDMFEDFGEFVGWWDVTDQTLSFFDDIMGNDEYDAKNVKLAPGFSFLGLISSADRTIKFPSALDAK